MLKQLQQRMAKYGARKDVEKSADSNVGSSPTGAAGSEDFQPAAPRPSARSAAPSGGGSGGCGGAVGAAERGLGQLGLRVDDCAVQDLLAEKDHNLRELRETVAPWIIR